MKKVNFKKGGYLSSKAINENTIKSYSSDLNKLLKLVSDKMGDDVFYADEFYGNSLKFGASPSKIKEMGGEFYSKCENVADDMNLITMTMEKLNKSQADRDKLITDIINKNTSKYKNEILEVVQKIINNSEYKSSYPVIKQPEIKKVVEETKPKKKTKKEQLEELLKSKVNINDIKDIKIKKTKTKKHNIDELLKSKVDIEEALKIEIRKRPRTDEKKKEKADNIEKLKKMLSDKVNVEDVLKIPIKRGKGKKKEEINTSNDLDPSKLTAEIVKKTDREAVSKNKEITRAAVDIKLFDLVFRRKEYPRDYSITEQELIKAIVSDPSGQLESLIKNNKVVLYGSHVYKGNVAAGDMDCMQFMPLDRHAQALRDIVYKIIYGDAYKEYYSKFYFFGDIKCGLVAKYKSLIDALGNVEKSIISGYKPEILADILSQTEYKDVKIPKKPNLVQWFKLYDVVHQLTTRRWTPKEILQGYQVDDNKNKYLLSDAVYESKLTKIDLYGGAIKAIEVTNVLQNSDIDNDDYKRFYADVAKDMMRHLLVNNNIMKAIKRVYVLERQKDSDKALTLDLHNFTQRSLAAKLYVISGELKIFKYIVENYFDKMTDTGLLQDHILNIQVLIQMIYTIDDKNLNYFINDIDNYIYHDIRDGNTEAITNIKKKCEEIISHLKNLINVYAEEFVKSNNIDFIKYFNEFV